MTALSKRRASPHLARGRALLPALLLCLLPLGAARPAGADSPVNSIRSLRTVFTPRGPVTYDITLNSSAEFPMTDSVVTLSIGGREFINSGYGTDGTLNTLVFSLTRSQFQSLKNGDPVVIYYGADNAAIPAAHWNFGPLDLGLLDKVTITLQPVRPVALADTPVTLVETPVTLTMTGAVRTMTTGAVRTMTTGAARAMAATAKIARKGHK